MKIRVIPIGHTGHEAFCSFANAPEKQTLLQNYFIIAGETDRRSSVMLRLRDDNDHLLYIARTKK
jgi:hypothetical protein